MGTSQTLGELRELYSRQSNRPKSNFSFKFRNRILMSDIQTFNGLEYTPDDIVRIVTKPGASAGTMQSAPANNQMGFNQNQGNNNMFNKMKQINDPNFVVQTPQIQLQLRMEAKQLKTYYDSNSYELDQLLERDPELGQAI